MYNLDKGQNHAKEFKETFIDFYHSGQFITQLSKKYNVTHSTIYKSIDLQCPMKNHSQKLML
ncbi:hypothetical protein DXX97_02885 [Lactococcus lactis]|nr:hypothetical protein [Lactococcus lactis]